MFDELEDDLMKESVSTQAGLPPPRENPDCFGHDDVERQLLDLISSNKLPHALIFAGPQGIGKSIMAFRLARYLLKHENSHDGPGLFGESLPEEKPDTLYVSPDSDVFRQVISGGHPDFRVIERPMDDKKGKRQDIVPVAEVRRVAPFLRMSASKGDWRVVIIDDADTMNASSQNAVLKVLEEPPANTVLILVAHRAGMFLPTIRSRCRTLTFTPLSQSDFKELIHKEDFSLQDRDIKTLYAMSGGSIGRAIDILEEGGLDVVSQIIGVLQTWPSWDWVKIHALADNLGRRGQEDSLRVFQDIFLWMMQAIVKAKATETSLPPLLDSEAIIKIQDYYDLAAWIDICDQLKAGFAQGHYANLDKRQVILNAFMQFETKKAA